MKCKMFERVIKMLPRKQLEDLARGYGIARPWLVEKKELEILLISLESKELRQDLVDIITRELLP